MDLWIAQLGTDIEGPVQYVSPAWLVELCVEAVGTGPVHWALIASEEIVKRLDSDFPEFTEADGRIRLTRLGAESCMLHVLLVLSGVRQADWFPEEQIQVVRDRARRDIPLSRLLGAIRLAHAVTSQIYLQTAAEFTPPEHQAQVLQRVSAAVMSLFDELHAQGESEYQAENQRWRNDGRERCWEVIDDVLTVASQDLTDVEEKLAYPIEGRMHLAAVAWSQTATQDKEAIEDQLRSWFKAAGARSILTIEREPMIVWGWGATETHENTSSPSEITSPSSEVRIAHGNWHYSLDGFRLSYRQAVAAEYAAALAYGIDEPIIAYNNVGLTSLLISHTERAQDFAITVLGPLIGSDFRKQELRETISAFLRLRSPKAVAEQLYVARGTVTYRLRQAEEILGYELESRTRELSAALMIVDGLPSMARHAKSSSKGPVE